MKRSLFATLLLVSLLGFNAFAQDAKPAQAGESLMTLTGVVYDVNGSVIVSESKVVARAPGGKVYEAGVNDEGIYTLRLPLGIYRVEARAQHFCASLVDGFKVVNATHGKMSLDFVLDVASSHLPCVRKLSPDEGPQGKDRKKSETIH